jgi:cell division protein ZapA
MAQVMVTINGRVYRMGCEEGQEHVLLGLAGELDRRIETFKSEFGEVGDMRLLIMAALAQGDELAETRRRLDAAEAELAELKQASESVEARVASVERAFVESLEMAAGRVEQLATSLNGQSRG